MRKEEYIEEQKLELTQSYGSLILLLGIPVILSLGLLDYFVTPENFAKFFVIRLVTASLYVPLYFLNKHKRDKTYQLIINVAGTLIVTIMVEVMILSFGGHESPYYAGIIIVYIFIFGFLPFFSMRTAIVLTSTTYAVYLLPILIFDHVTNIRIFMNNNIFLLASLVIGLIWRSYNDSLLVKKFSFEYDLSQDKEKLEMYSKNLEDLVRERTRELAISETWHRSIFDNATDGIIVLNKKGEIVNVNQKTCELHGFDREALIGIHIDLLEANGDKDKREERTERILNGETLIYETEHYKKDGTKVLLEVSSKSLEIEGQTYIQVVLQRHNREEEDTGTIDAFAEDGVCRFPCGRHRS